MKMKSLIVALFALAVVIAGCEGSDPLTSSSVQCQNPGDTVVVVRCGDDTGPTVPAVP